MADGLCSLISFVLPAHSVRIFCRDMFAEDRHARQKCCEKPERVVQADSLGQEANDGWSRQQTRVTRRSEGGNGQSLWHFLLRTRESEQDRHDVCGSQAHKDETDKRDPCERCENEAAQSKKRYPPTTCQDKAVPESRYDAIADETAERHRDGEEHVSQPSVRNRDEVFADKQKRTPVEQSPLHQE